MCCSVVERLYTYHCSDSRSRFRLQRAQRRTKSCYKLETFSEDDRKIISPTQLYQSGILILRSLMLKLFFRPKT